MAPDWTLGSPGYSLRQLLRDMSQDTLRAFLDRELVEILAGLEPSLSGKDALVEATLKVYDANELLADKDSRLELLRHLPLEKAEELLDRLDYRSGHNPFRTLERLFASPSSAYLEQLLAFFGVSIDVQSSRQTSSNQYPLAVDTSYGLFPFQRFTLRALLSVLEENNTALLHMPTGSGKTRTTMHLISRHLCTREEGLVFWLSEQPEVLDQSAKAFAKAWNHLGDRQLEVFRLFGSEDIELEDLNSGFVVGGFQKLYSLHKHDENFLLRLGDRTDLVVVDEAHQAIAPTYNSVIRALSRKRRGTRLLGLTATPGRTWSDVDEDYRLSEFFEGRKVSLITGDNRNPIRFLIEEGYLSKPTFRHIELGSENESDRHGGINNTKLVEEILGMLEEHSRLLVFASSVRHARLLSSVLSYKGVECGVVTAETSDAAREHLYHKFRRSSSKHMVLLNYGVLTTGFDAPVASGAVIARSTRSLVLFSQMVGRVLRGPQADGTREAEIVTTVDTQLPGFGSVREAFTNWEDVWDDE